MTAQRKTVSEDVPLIANREVAAELRTLAAKRVGKRDVVSQLDRLRLETAETLERHPDDKWFSSKLELCTLTSLNLICILFWAPARYAK